jgi:hypothetical protein
VAPSIKGIAMKKNLIQLIDYYHLAPSLKWPDLVILHALYLCEECSKRAFIQEHVNVVRRILHPEENVNFETMRKAIDSLIHKGYIIQNGDYISIDMNLLTVKENTICNRTNYLLTTFLDVKDLMLLDFITYWYFQANKSEYRAMKWDDFVRIAPDKFTEQFQMTFKQINNRLKKLCGLKFLNMKKISINKVKQVAIYKPELQYEAWVDLKKKIVAVSYKDEITQHVFLNCDYECSKPSMSPQERLSFEEGCGAIQEDLLGKMCFCYLWSHGHIERNSENVFIQKEPL